MGSVRPSRPRGRQTFFRKPLKGGIQMCEVPLTVWLTRTRQRNVSANRFWRRGRMRGEKPPVIEGDRLSSKVSWGPGHPACDGCRAERPRLTSMSTLRPKMLLWKLQQLMAAQWKCLTSTAWSLTPLPRTSSVRRRRPNWPGRRANCLLTSLKTGLPAFTALLPLAASSSLPLIMMDDDDDDDDDVVFVYPHQKKYNPPPDGFIHVSDVPHIHTLNL